MPGIPKAQYRRPTTTELLSEIANTQQTEDGDNDFQGLRTGRSYTKRKRGATRKEQRKQEREQKKKRRVHFHAKGHTDEPDTKKVAPPGGKANANSTSAKASGAKRSIFKKPDPETEEAKKARRVQKLAEQNPHFFSTLDVGQILAMGGDPQLRQAPGTSASNVLAEEDRERRYLEKMLGIKASESGKITSGMKADGLDYLLGNFDGDESDDQANGINIESLESDEYDSDLLPEAYAGAGSRSATEDEADDDDDAEPGTCTDFSDAPFTLFADDSSQDYVSSDTSDDDDDRQDMARSDGDSDSDDDDDGSDEEHGLEICPPSLPEPMPTQEANVGDARVQAATNLTAHAAPSSMATRSRLLSKSASQTATAPARARYVPPHLRAKVATSSEPVDEQTQRLRRQVQGLLNRLGENNLESIATETVQLYRDNPRALVNQALTKVLLQTLTSQTNLLGSFVSLIAAYVATIHRLVGTESAAGFIQEAMELLDKVYETAHTQSVQRDAREHNDTQSSTLDTANGKESDNDDEEQFDTATRECVALVALLGELYNYHVITHRLLYDLMLVFSQTVVEIDVELVLKLVKVAGHQLRQDDPLLLKEIIVAINKAAKEYELTRPLSARTKFMLDMFSQLRTNRMKASLSASVETTNRLKKFLGGLANKHKDAVVTAEPLGVSLQDIRDVDTRGKWWLVGSSWTGHGNFTGTGQDNSQGGPAATTGSAGTPAAGDRWSKQLLAMARRLKLNTDIRRSIFMALMTSEDYVECFERLLRLQLKETQEREIPRVLLRCCASEKVYNPYYAVVAEKLCQFHRRFKVTFRFTLWDFLRQVGGIQDENTVAGAPDTLVGMDRGSDGEYSSHGAGLGEKPVFHIVNYARFYAHLICQQALSLAVLKPINFAKLSTHGTLFLQFLFIHIYLTFGTKSRADVQSLIEIFGRAPEHSEVLANGVLFFLMTYVKQSNLAKSDAEKAVLKWGCKLTKEVFENHGRR
ncbi:suppressor of glycerol defect [Dimargaris verticillata]|uniref:Suppressor of glycerol defect n=1 Tax=Dimargaris verticillata TaxID=2761393 RepID=A0A9W8EDU4_9FUNG|nr:suppressor of glycerol defect [Dimargaris verticillata]